ncbi:uncharacterized protein LOC111713837 [Eurytemora carolleeae]|uniref:uncharacterized protein LOC111713837 n=1 Tax=Eurytemora carolleeae TaxID=1294199 RepID=UPI000C764096|nr:uncharacterized protein LOC111713837 [Eurytemora carolleeae]XP_023344557.1 uncharacterized protein LOC111713837 [Eurytemora carolleeae]XP_023344558.1 uncharacterized protein LOC111713837 [Eurytemora carolleeae]|eukprot:XP_023344556.1 uncharacterized protein LOC111713837 [Eurytemora affinis]
MNEVGKRLITKEVATEEDMVEFEMNTSLLGELIPKSFPNFPITPKLDVLVMVAPRSLRFWQGRWQSEENLESIHALSNRACRNSFYWRDNERRMNFIVQYQELNRKSLRLASQFKARPRKCQHCETYLVRKKCPKCGKS